MKAIVALVALLASAQAPPGTGPAQVSQRDFKRLAAARKILIVDVRPAGTFREGHIPRAISLPFMGERWPAEYDKAVETLKAATKPIVIYCACHGETFAIRAAGVLSEAGVKDARVLVGGWNVWFNDGNSVATGPR
jgi:rhodanese-related sulfurtransferase